MTLAWGNEAVPSGPDPMARCGACVWFKPHVVDDERYREGACTFNPHWIDVVADEHYCSHFRVTKAGLREWIDRNRKVPVQPLEQP